MTTNCCKIEEYSVIQDNIGLLNGQINDLQTANGRIDGQIASLEGQKSTLESQKANNVQEYNALGALIKPRGIDEDGNIIAGGSMVERYETILKYVNEPNEEDYKFIKSKYPDYIEDYQAVMLMDDIITAGETRFPTVVQRSGAGVKNIINMSNAEIDALTFEDMVTNGFKISDMSILTDILNGMGITSISGSSGGEAQTVNICANNNDGIYNPSEVVDPEKWTEVASLLNTAPDYLETPDGSQISKTVLKQNIKNLVFALNYPEANENMEETGRWTNTTSTISPYQYWNCIKSFMPIDSNDTFTKFQSSVSRTYNSSHYYPITLTNSCIDSDKYYGPLYYELDPAGHHYHPSFTYEDDLIVSATPLGGYYRVNGPATTIQDKYVDFYKQFLKICKGIYAFAQSGTREWTEKQPQLDIYGHQTYDEDGNIIYITKKDGDGNFSFDESTSVIYENGNDLVDEDGNPIYKGGQACYADALRLYEERLDYEAEAGPRSISALQSQWYDLEAVIAALDASILDVQRQIDDYLIRKQNNTDSINTLNSQIVAQQQTLATTEMYNPIYSQAQIQWYVNLWHRMNGESENKSLEGDSGKYYKVLENNLLKSSSWLQFALEQGIVTIEQVQTEKPAEDGSGLKQYNLKWQAKEYSTCVDFQFVDDETAIAKAEAIYTKKLKEIEAEDKKFDNEIKKLDTEHSALQTEYESVKSVVDKNVERSFKAFS